MTLVSYAQNCEDVMLWRALKPVKKGFYIDVGANDPAVESVTKSFYDRGWSGINIEPVKAHYQKLQAERPRDITLGCAAGATTGVIDLFECDVRGWATASRDVAEKHIREGHEGVYHQVPMRRLADICREYVTGDIHFLKIDVEGFEAQVLQGADFNVYRPWVVVVEATQPGSTEETHELLENLLIPARYQFAYADGINRFYVADERSGLLPAFKYPPNIFDDYMSNGQRQAEAHARWMKNEKEAIKRTAEDYRLAIQELRALLDRRNRELQSVYGSLSWRLTWPLRQLMLGGLHLAIRFKGPSSVGSGTQVGHKESADPGLDLSSCSPRARQIYSDLKGAVELHQKDIR